VSEWREKPLGQVASLSWGDTSTTKASYAASGWPAYSASGRDGFLPHFDHEEDAVVISAIGALCGKTWLARGRWSCIKNTMWMRALPGEADNRFLYHATRRSDFWPRRGAAQPFISLGDARSTLVDLPPVDTQRRVAAVLSAFDELMEINDRRIELLEDLARSLYREWFVRFRFPGHEGVDNVQPGLGRIPADWRMTPLGEAAASLVDGDWIETKDQGGRPYRLLQVSNIGVGAFRETGKFRYIDEATFERLRCTEVELGDILISRMPDPIGRAWLVDRLGEPAITAVDVAILRPPSRTVGVYLSYWLNSPPALSRAEAVATGTTRKRISRTVLAGVSIPLPPEALLEGFAAAVEPALAERTLVLQTVDRLAATRDLLLPRLVTGRLDISDIDLGELLPSEAE
jgi:restriction endonuclease S subunit